MRGPKLTVYPKGVLLETYRRRLIALRDDGFNDDFMAALEEVHRQLEKHDALAARLAEAERLLRYWTPDETMVKPEHSAEWDRTVKWLAVSASVGQEK